MSARPCRTFPSAHCTNAGSRAPSIRSRVINYTYRSIFMDPSYAPYALMFCRHKKSRRTGLEFEYEFSCKLETWW